jgi:type IV secretory pathway VirB2 component (pilin)
MTHGTTIQSADGNRRTFIIIIIIIILGISAMQGIYTYISETNHVPREHCVTTILM